MAGIRAWKEFFRRAHDSAPDVVLLAYGIWPLGGNYAQMYYTLQNLPISPLRLLLVCNTDTTALAATPWIKTLVLPWRSQFIAGKWLAQALLGVLLIPRLWHRLAGEAMIWPLVGIRTATLADLNYYHINPESATSRLKQFHFQCTAMMTDHFYAISRFTANDLAQHGVARRRISVLYHGAGKPGVRPAYSAPRLKPPFILTFGQHAHKRCDLVVAAVARLRSAGLSLHVVCLGGAARRTETLARAGITGPAEWYETPGWLDDEKVKAMYLECAVVAFLTDFEGFGLPMLEGFEAGAPILASDLDVLREIGGDGAWYCRHDLASIQQNLSGILAETADERDSRKIRQQRILRQFSWTRVGAELMSDWMASCPPHQII